MTEYLERVPEGIAYANNEFMPLQDLQVSIADLGFTQGAATYEVAHAVDGRIFKPEWHIERFLESSDGMALDVPYDETALLGIMKQCAARSGFDDVFIWLGVTQGIPESGLPRDYDTCEPRFYAYAKELYGISGEREVSPEPVSLAVSSVVRIPPQSVDPRHKNHHWLDLRRAQMLAQREGYDTTVLIDLEGDIAEGPGFNVCVVKDGVVMSPDGTVLEGVTRRSIRAIANELEIPFKLGSISPEELVNADEVFLASTSGGITPVQSVDQVLIKAPRDRSLTQILQDSYWEKHSDPGWSVAIAS